MPQEQQQSMTPEQFWALFATRPKAERDRLANVLWEIGQDLLKESAAAENDKQEEATAKKTRKKGSDQ